MSARTQFEEEMLARIKEDCYREVDGYMVWASSRGGFLTAPILRLIADYLDEVNKEWHEEVVRSLDELNESQQGEDEEGVES